jgi:hypothetical protein
MLTGAIGGGLVNEKDLTASATFDGLFKNQPGDRPHLLALTL